MWKNVFFYISGRKVLHSSWGYDQFLQSFQFRSGRSPTPPFKQKSKASCWGTTEVGGSTPSLSSTKLPEPEQISFSSSQQAQTPLLDLSLGQAGLRAARPSGSSAGSPAPGCLIINSLRRQQGHPQSQTSQSLWVLLELPPASDGQEVTRTHQVSKVRRG